MTNPQPAVRVDARVKDLEWVHGTGNIPGQEVWNSGDPWVFWIVKNPDSEYIWCENLGFADMVPASPVRGSFATLDEAKAAAQADYEARILSALTPAPTEAGGVREALTAIIADWDSRSVGEQERFVPPSDVLPGYWSPNARMVPSERIAAGRAALSSTPAADAGWQRPEDTAEQFIQAAVDRAPEPLRRLGEWLASVLDDDDWKTAERMLLGAAVHPADPRDEFELWAGDDNRDLAAQEFEERDPDNFLFYAADSTNQAYIGWYFASRPTPQPGGAR